MSDLGFKPWSDNPNAPKISHAVYITEKGDLSGYLLASILYGMLIVLFFKCITALLNPIYRRGESIKLGLVSYTVVMFSLATVFTAMNLDLESIAYIDNPNFTGITGVEKPGPLGYLDFIYLKTINVVPNVAFVVSNWLGDGFLLYRCYVIHSMSLWVIAFPCLIYLSSVVMGVLAVISNWEGAMSYIPFFSISVSLNVTLTLMIVLRLVLHGRCIRAATGSRAGIGGLYKTIATMFIESCALFAMSSLFLVGSMTAKNGEASSLAAPILGEIQIIAPLLIIQRVANRSALTSTTIPGSVGFRTRSRGELTDGSGALCSEHSMGPIGERRTNSGENGIGVETTVDSRRDMV